MTHSTPLTSPQATDVIAEQARKVQAIYPELYAYLEARDRKLNSLRARMCHPDDLECWGAPNINEQIVGHLRSLESGIGDLVSSKR